MGATILEVLRAHGHTAPSSCESGTCGTCRTGLVSGDVDHRDLVLTPAERARERSWSASRAEIGASWCWTYDAARRGVPSPTRPHAEACRLLQGRTPRRAGRGGDDRNQVRLRRRTRLVARLTSSRRAAPHRAASTPRGTSCRTRARASARSGAAPWGPLVLPRRGRPPAGPLRDRGGALQRLGQVRLDRLQTLQQPVDLAPAQRPHRRLHHRDRLRHQRHAAGPGLSPSGTRSPSAGPCRDAPAAPGPPASIEATADRVVGSIVPISDDSSLCVSPSSIHSTRRKYHMPRVTPCRSIRACNARCTRRCVMRIW